LEKSSGICSVQSSLGILFGLWLTWTEFKNQGWNWNAKYDSPLISVENIHCHGV